MAEEINKVFCVIRIMGRPQHTMATLRSLAQCNAYKDFDTTILFDETLDLGTKDFIDLVRLVEGCRSTKRFTPQVIFNDVVGSSYSHNLALAFLMFRAREKEHPWFLWVENDMLFRRDWFERLLTVRASAEGQGLKVGMITPHTVIAKRYRQRDLGAELPYYIRKLTQNCAVLYDRETALSVSLDAKWVNDGKIKIDFQIADGLNKLGYTHIAPKVSLACHIGIGGYRHADAVARWKKRGSGGVGFEPDPSIKDLWEIFKDGLR